MKFLLTLAVAVFLFVYINADTSCTTNSDNLCKTCTTTNGYSCAGTNSGTAYSCVAPSGTPPSSDNPCSISSSNKYCAAGVNATGPNFSGLTQANANIGFQYCNNVSSSAQTNPSCCSSNVACPNTCSGVQSGVTFTNQVPVTRYCYPYCTSCSGLGHTDSYCSANCGSSAAYDCATSTTCCPFGGAAASLASWMSYLF